MTLEFTEPLFLLSAQTGLSVAELQALAAEGNPNLSGPQPALKTGEPIPMFFVVEEHLVECKQAGQ